MSQRGIFLVLIAAASWGTYSLFLRPTGLPGTSTAPILFVAMAACSLPFCMTQPRAVWDRRTVTLLLLYAGFDALNVVAFFAAISYTTVAVAVLTHYLAPVIVALGAPRLEGTRSRATRPAAIVALLGLAIILEPWRAPADGVIVGSLLGATSAVCYAGNTFVLRRLNERIGATRSMAYHSVISALLLAPLLALPGPAIELSDIGYVSAAAVTIGALSGIVYIKGLALIGSARAAVLCFVEPLVAVSIGALWFGERLSPFAALGGALVLGAGIAVVRGGPGPSAARSGDTTPDAA